MDAVSDRAARYRAIRAWANLDQDQLAKKLGKERQYVIRREKDPGEKNAQEPGDQDLIAAAAVCGVPIEFALHGFAAEVVGTEDGRRIGDRLSVIEESLESRPPPVIIPLTAEDLSPQERADAIAGLMRQLAAAGYVAAHTDGTDYLTIQEGFKLTAADADPDDDELRRELEGGSPTEVDAPPSDDRGDRPAEGGGG